MNCNDIFTKIGLDNLSEVQEKIIQSHNKNILILSSCGSGKTEAAYSKVLEWKGKTILVEPMKTLANNLKSRLCKYNKILGLTEWTVQHSSNKGDKFLNNEYCITTIDQVLSGYLAMGKQSFIKGKNIIQSNLIFDEVQLFDTDKMLLTTINMLDSINELGNKFIIMTATMPQYLIDFLKDRYNMDIIITEKERIINRKVKLDFISELNYEDINNYKDKQIIICNTVKQLREVYKNLNKDRVMILHSKFYSSDREKLEENVVRYFGKNSNKNNKILLTTQVIEAGMDISASRIYSANCPIDNLIQRHGRCCRWGGDGDLIIFKTTDKIYDRDIVELTNNYIRNNKDINFNWDIQKLWLNEILNPFYENKINKKTLKKNKLNFKYYRRDKLIRDIQNVNIIICNKDVIEKNDFSREPVSIYINELKDIAKNNKLYALNKGKVLEIEWNNVDIGDTIVIQGINCIYDDLGFRYHNKNTTIKNNIKSFPFISKQSEIFEDYAEESWLHHAESTKELFYKKLKQEYFNEYVKENIDKIAFQGGLHDLGKLDYEWQRKIKNNTNIPLAHFPFQKGFRSLGSKHQYIGAYVLKDKIDSIIFNMILQHHGRVPVWEGEVQKVKWNINKDYIDILKEYGLKDDLCSHNNVGVIINDNDVMTPNDNDWTTILYLIGTLMESEIQCIKDNNTKLNEVG